MTELRFRAFVVIRVVLGILLLATAGLKIYGWSVSTVPPVGWFSAQEVQGAAIGWEILLSVWLLCGVAMFGSWLAAIGTFTLLAGVSGYLGWIGQATCDCFGTTIKASPWHAFAVDILALGLLAVGHPKWEAVQTVSGDGLGRNAKAIAQIALAIGELLASLVGIGSAIYGSPEAALARLRGESLTIRPAYIDFGVGQPGAILVAEVEVFNWTDHPIRLIGGTSDCTCRASVGLPITIPVGESRIIPIQLRLKSVSNGIFTRKAEIWTNEDSQRTLTLYLGCRVRLPGSRSQAD